MERRIENESAVSPIVATLVLIVVAVVGAVAVGTIMGAFSGDVSNQVNSGDVGAASSAEILIAGSTTVQPAAEAVSREYMKTHKGIRITVQGGGSGAGVSSVGMGIVDIGASSSPLSDAQKEKYPDLVTHQIGGSGVVFVMPAVSTATAVEKNAVIQMYNTTVDADGDGIVGWTDDGDNIIEAAEIGDDTAGTAITIYQRAEASGTETTVAKDYLGKGETYIDSSKAVGVSGNAGMKAAIAGGAANARFGFLDFGYTDTTVKTLNIVEGAVTYTTSKTNILAALKDVSAAKPQGSNYPQKLARPLLFITNGEPNSVVKNFIDWTRSPATIKILEEEVGVFHVLTINA